MCPYPPPLASRAQKFWWFTLANILVDSCGAALGIFVSCLFHDINMALTILPLFLLPLMLFAGFFVNSESIPPYFWWIQARCCKLLLLPVAGCHPGYCICIS